MLEREKKQTKIAEFYLKKIEQGVLQNAPCGAVWSEFYARVTSHPLCTTDYFMYRHQITEGPTRRVWTRQEFITWDWATLNRKLCP